MLCGAHEGRRGGVVLVRVLRARPHGDPSKAGLGGPSTWPTEDMPGGAVVQGVPGQEAATHLILDEGEVTREATPRAGAR
jgi:hypothetical protein